MRKDRVHKTRHFFLFRCGLTCDSKDHHPRKKKNHTMPPLTPHSSIYTHHRGSVLLPVLPCTGIITSVIIQPIHALFVQHSLKQTQIPCLTEILTDRRVAFRTCCAHCTHHQQCALHLIAGIVFPYHNTLILKPNTPHTYNTQ